ncbi:MAG: hypothetical protein ABI588_03520 [Arenimonas sp.]
MTIRIYDKQSGAQLGDIDQEDLDLMIDQFEEESSRDRDYFIDRDTIELLDNAGGSPKLLALLRSVVGTSDGVDIRWEEA